jgi:hypothetical protein
MLQGQVISLGIRLERRFDQGITLLAAVRKDRSGREKSSEVLAYK